MEEGDKRSGTVLKLGQRFLKGAKRHREPFSQTRRKTRTSKFAVYLDSHPFALVLMLMLLPLLCYTDLLHRHSDILQFASFVRA